MSVACVTAGRRKLDRCTIFDTRQQHDMCVTAVRFGHASSLSAKLTSTLRVCVHPLSTSVHELQVQRCVASLRPVHDLQDNDENHIQADTAPACAQKASSSAGAQLLVMAALLSSGGLGRKEKNRLRASAAAAICTRPAANVNCVPPSTLAPCRQAHMAVLYMYTHVQDFPSHV